MALNLTDLAAEIFTWESKALYPPNRRMYRRALVALGYVDKWGVGGLTASEAYTKMRKERKDAGKEKWQRIAHGIEQYVREKKPKSAETLKPEIQAYDNPVKLAQDMSARTKSAYERENENLRKTISQKNREIKNLMALGKSHTCGNCIETQQKAQETAHIQANALHQKDLKINMLQRKVNDLVHSFQTQKMSNSLDKITADKYKKLSTRLALALKRAEQAEAHSRTLEKETRELTAKLELGGDSVEVDSLKKENEILWGKLQKAEQKLADDTIDWDVAITGLMQGRVLEPEIGKISLTNKDEHDLNRFADIWAVTLDTLPGIYVYGMKHKESNICKRHNIKIDDYGQPETATLADFDLARAISYMDGAISHAHQEIQAVVRMARILTGAKQ